MGEVRQIHPELITIFNLAIGSGRAYAAALYAKSPPDQLERALREELSATPATLSVRARGYLQGQRAAVQELIQGKSPANPAQTGRECRIGPQVHP